MCTTLHGKQARAPMKAISARQYSREGSARLTPRLRRSLQSLRKILRSARAREVHEDGARRQSHVIYIDAEGSGQTAGVLFREGRTRPLFFRWKVPKSWDDWLEPRKTQIGVYEAATAPVALASFAEYIRDSDIVLFIDNIGAQGALSSGYGETEDICTICETFWELAAEINCGVWMERVDSKSNIADGPSRDPASTPFGSTRCKDLASLDPIQLSFIDPFS